jgi:hypothetical protein
MKVSQIFGIRNSELNEAIGKRKTGKPEMTERAKN